MATTNKRSSAELLIYLLPFFLLIVLAVLYYPSYKYHIEGDGIGYLASVKRYVNGDYYNAVNGYWSPLNIWIVAILVKFSGWPIVQSAYLVNTLAFSGVLLLGIKLASQFIKSNWIRCLLGITMAIYWAVNMQLALFADGINAFLLLSFLLLLLRSDFYQRPVLWVCAGVIAALAYLSKAYSFYAIPLLTLIISYYKRKTDHGFTWRDLKRPFTITATVAIIMVALSFPWIYILHDKYKIWTISTSGTLNSSWLVYGKMYFGDEINVLVPPPYKDSLSCWEDLWFHKGQMVGMFSSAEVFLLKIRRLFINLMKWPGTVSEISPFYFVIWVCSIAYLFRLRNSADPKPRWMTLLLVFLIFPIGYFIVSVNARYIWFTVPLAMTLGLIGMQQWLFPRLNHFGKKLLVILYMISWLPASVLQMITTRQDGQAFYGMAEKLKELYITDASFVSNNGTTNLNQDFCISYYTNNSVFMNFKEDWTMGELLEESLKFKVKYLFYFYQNDDKDFILKDANGMPYPEMTHGAINGLKVFQLTR